MSRQIISLVVAASVAISSIALVSTNAMAFGPDSGRIGPNARYNPSGVYYHHRHGTYYHGGYR
jgi:hypothetical protein